MDNEIKIVKPVQFRNIVWDSFEHDPLDPNEVSEFLESIVSSLPKQDIQLFCNWVATCPLEGSDVAIAAKLLLMYAKVGLLLAKERQHG